MSERLVLVVEWLQKAALEWAQQQGGYPAEVALAGEMVAIASVDDDGAPVLELYVLEQAEHAIEFADKRPDEMKMVAFADGIENWVNRQVNKYLEDSN